MTGLLASIAIALASSVACDRSQTSTGDNALPGRSEAIAAADSMPLAVVSDSSATQAASSSATAHAGTTTPRKLCEGELGRPGRRLPKGTFTPIAAAGAEPPSRSAPTTGAKRWTWINFFAAWCGPCKEEMPRLRGFQQRLASNMDVTFVSVDDDERQLKKFLADQPATGVRSALWLQPKPREAWLSALNMKDPPDLPAHVLVDPSGNVRCITGGAVEDADFATVATIVKQ